jgi:riboflavin kinase
LNCIKFNGILFTGEGEGKKYLALPWVNQQLKKNLGYEPFLGTLNLKLTAESVKHKKDLVKTKSIAVYPAEGYCVGLLFKAAINFLDCAVIIPQIQDYPENVLEVIAQVNLREKLGLKDGDAIAVSVQV